MSDRLEAAREILLFHEILIKTKELLLDVKFSIK